MVIIPIEPNTLDIIAAMNGGLKPKIDPKEHSSFIYHGKDKLNEIVPSIYVGTLLASGDYQIIEMRAIVKNVEEKGV
jgi:hypothetical protein